VAFVQCLAGGATRLLLLLLLLLLQGTYEVNVLVAGRGATGISAIKATSRANQRGLQQVQA
jgi:hypothetical protein